MKKYEIEPIKWERTKNDSPEGVETSYTFGSIFGMMYIYKYPKKYAKEFGWDTHIQFNYCFDEYYDEGHSYFSSVKEAKDHAEKFYLERLLPALKEVECS